MTEKLVPSAKVVDGILILSLPDALRPVVWQMELGQSRTSALEVREQEDGTCHLTLKTPRQDVLEMAPYATKAQAIRALQTVAAAMEKAHGQLRPYAHAAMGSENGDSPVSPYPVPAIPYAASICNSLTSRSGVLRLAALAIVFLALVVFFVFSGGGGAPSSIGANGDSRATTNSVQTGTPVSADDFLEGQ